MISQETAARIWECYREIEAGQTLLKDLAEAANENDDLCAPALSDVFGRKRHLQLGVPSGNHCHRLLRVDPGLAESVIRAHIANQEDALAEANEHARIELRNGSKS